MRFFETIRLLVRHWLTILISTVVVTAAVFAVSATRTSVYTATAEDFFGLTTGGSAGELASGATYVQDQMASFGELATSPVVLNPVISDLGLATTPKDLAKVVSVSTPRNTVILTISVTDPSASRAAAIANAISNQLSRAVTLVGPKLAAGKPFIAVNSIQAALPPTVQSSPNTRLNTAMGFLIGLLLGIGLVVGRARLSNVVRTAEDVAQVTTRRVLGGLRHDAATRAGALAVVQRPSDRFAEDVRRVRAGVERLATGRPHYSLVVTSATRGEGRTTVAANLAAALAEAGHSTVLIDADLRNPQVASRTGTDPQHGLVPAFHGSRSVLSTLQGVTDSDLAVLAAGGREDRPTELLNSETMAEAVSSLRAHYRFVIIDSPSSLATADAAALRDHVDGALLVIRGSAITRDQLDQTLNATELTGLDTVGIILNDLSDRDLPRAAGYAPADPAAQRTTGSEPEPETDIEEPGLVERAAEHAVR